MNVYKGIGRTPLEEFVTETIYIAAQDYRKVRRIMERNPDCFVTRECIQATSRVDGRLKQNHAYGLILRPEELLKEIEDFFYTPFFQRISTIDPDEIVRLLRSNAKRDSSKKLRFHVTDFCGKKKTAAIVNDPHCEGCIHYRKFNPSGYDQMCCHYWEDEDRLRECPPGKDCDKYDDNPKNLHRPELWEQSIKVGTLRRRRDR